MEVLIFVQSRARENSPDNQVARLTEDLIDYQSVTAHNTIIVQCLQACYWQ